MTDTLSEREKMLAGEIYFVPDAELNAMTDSARLRLKAFNETPRGDLSARMGRLRRYLGGRRRRPGSSRRFSPTTAYTSSLAIAS
jgi:Maltose acetyltransferase